ncbi:MAG TPA: NAD(P)/FAD-dependent oxidoreductase [Aggregatilineales bacterium]|nr:NAD(P)/FAD-dependent oxidoreductase [Anaerolineales bacterium]HRE49615.1 NAD(P)/FAD-dependent oxidoreductase [Aggregatilineales bacterium]
MTRYDGIVIGSGPNGLAAAITLAQAGWRVLLIEGKATLGGGLRTLELTRPGFRHDMCSAVHPLALISPFFRALTLPIPWLYPSAELAHPLDDAPAVLVERSLEATAAGLGSALDARRYRQVFAPLVDGAEALIDQFLAPLHFPRHPFRSGYFGALALLSARRLARTAFEGERARALFGGMAAHGLIPLTHPTTAAFGLLLTTLAHAVGWALPRGGSQTIADALAAHLRALGGEIVTDLPITAMRDLPPARAYFFDVAPRNLLRIVGDRFPPRYRRQLDAFRYGAGVFKIDYALSEPIPWRDPAIWRAATVHLGGTLAELCDSERAMREGRHAERPYTLLVQPTLFDASRIPPEYAGAHIAWAYCHVPHGSTTDMTAAIERQFERFAPGFRHCITARVTHHTAALEAYNPNYIGGDINAGVQDWRQLYTRPVLRWSPYTTPDPAIYLCSSSTPPGGGVHGLCGCHAARAALHRLGGKGGI